MSRTLLPAAAHIICEHGTHVLLIKRSLKTDPWPGYWAFPGGKLENGELFRECAIRELQEEVGIVAGEDVIQEEIMLQISWNPILLQILDGSNEKIFQNHLFLIIVSHLRPYLRALGILNMI